MKLAINGGKPIRTKLFKRQRGFEQEEINAVKNFLDNNTILSGYRGSYGKNFMGGTQVKMLEEQFEKMFGAKALAVNSCTSALHIACLALLQLGDEVIVTPWSMTCSATAPLIAGAIPIFADIEYDTFCLDPKSIVKFITPKTKAIIAVDLFGHPFNQEICDIADEYELYIIEDAAQAIGANYNNQYTGVLGDIGCFSFTQGKHLTCGEGGMLTTNNLDIYEKCALIRNHAEAVINDMPLKEQVRLGKLWGMNLRMTEIQAVILQEQLKKLSDYIHYRIHNVQHLSHLIAQIEGIQFPQRKENYTHSYYVMPFYYDQEKVGIHRNKFIDAVKAELVGDEERIDRGVPISKGYITPLYKMPIFNTKFNQENYPNVEKLQNDEFFLTLYHGLQLSNNDIYDIANAFYKVYENRNELK